MVKIIIIGSAISGNKGDASMVKSILDNFKEYSDNFNITILSYYPDKQENKYNYYNNLNTIYLNPYKVATHLLPLSFLYYIFHPIKPIKNILLKYKPLKEIENSDISVDLGGITFSDKRRIILLFNISCLLVPFFMKKRSIKYAQAMGPFNNITNKLAAKILLPHVDLIIARGKITKNYLDNLGLKNTVCLTEGALSLKASDKLVSNKIKDLVKQITIKKKKKYTIIGIAPSSVVYQYCKKNNKDYIKIISDFINKKLLEKEDYIIVLFPYSARQTSNKLKNNDLPIVKSINKKIIKHPNYIPILNEYSVEDLNYLISKFDLLITSRFHGMISALASKVIPLIIGWSHKYFEILNEFEISSLNIPFKDLTLTHLEKRFIETLSNKKTLEKNIEKNHSRMAELSKKNCYYINEEIKKTRGKNELYLGKFEDYFIGFSKDPIIRKHAASGGLVTAYLSYLFDNKKISAALVSKIYTEDGLIKAKGIWVKSKEELFSTQSSIYMDFNLVSKFKEIKDIEGKVAIVALPCQLNILNHLMKRDKEIQEKVYCKLGLVCGHASEKKLLKLVLETKGIKESDIEKFYFRQGLWRGKTHILLKNGKTIKFPFNDFGLYQNLFLFCVKRCHYCIDHFAEKSDITFGDVWLKEYKSNIKHSLIIARNKIHMKDLLNMKKDSTIVLNEIHPSIAFKAQKRTRIYQNHTINAIKRIKKKGILTRKPRWNDHIAARIILFNEKIAHSKWIKTFMKIPKPLTRFYMYIEKFFQNF
jgi:coenzyme F420-reducing hydrogenase beta subunit